MALYIAYAWLQVSQLGSASATYDIYDADNYPLVCPTLPAHTLPSSAPGLPDQPSQACGHLLWRILLRITCSSWLHLASWCQENAKDIAERCIALICHAALAVHLPRHASASCINSFVPSSRIQKHTLT